jgi:uncharacterized protein YegL
MICYTPAVTFTTGAATYTYPLSFTYALSFTAESISREADMTPRNSSGQAETPSPRLPVYLLLDCSGTMYGQKLASVTNGVVAICETLKSDPRSADTVYISVIWFNDQAYQTPLTPINSFAIPQLQALGRTALGAALRALNASLDRDLRPTAQQGSAPTNASSGDFRPLVFLLTDGQPSDDWRLPAEELSQRTSHRPLHIVGLAIGDDADVKQIAKVATDVHKIDGHLQDQLRDYFDWVADSVILAASEPQKRWEQSEATSAPPLPPVPGSVTLIRGFGSP